MGCRVDPNLLEWPENDFRVFVGDLGNETNDEVLTKAFAKYPTFNKAKVVRDKKSNKTKGISLVRTVYDLHIISTNQCRANLLSEQHFAQTEPTAD